MRPHSLNLLGNISNSRGDAVDGSARRRRRPRFHSVDGFWRRGFRLGGDGENAGGAAAEVEEGVAAAQGRRGTIEGIDSAVDELGCCVHGGNVFLFSFVLEREIGGSGGCGVNTMNTNYVKCLWCVCLVSF